MGRNLTAQMIAQLTSKALSMAFACEIDTVSGNNIFVWSGQGTLAIGSGPLAGKTFIGVAGLYTVSAIPESASPTATGLKLTLNGVDASLLGEALSDLNQGKPAYLWLLCFDSSGNLVTDPYQTFAGSVDLVESDIVSDKASISVNVENALIDLHRMRMRRYTPEDQQLDYPGDMGFNYVAQLQQATLSWGVSGGVPTWGDSPISPGFVTMETVLLTLGAFIVFQSPWIVLGGWFTVMARRFIRWLLYRRQLRRDSWTAVLHGNVN